MPAGRSNASNLLQKVNSQLRGQRVPIKTEEEDELAIYLQGLSQKTQKAKDIGFEDHGDISISSGVEALPASKGRRSASPAEAAVQLKSSGSKFLKKKKPDHDFDEAGYDRDIENENGKPGKEIVIDKRGKGTAKAKSNLFNSGRTSALDKASALANKIKGRSVVPVRKHRHGDSDTDESVRGSDVGKRPGSADTSIGHDGHRFLKGRKTVDDSNHDNMRSSSPQIRQQDRSLDKEEPVKKTGSKTKGEIVRTLGNVYLTSEEESLAEFIHGLSTSETSKKPQNLVAKKQQKWRKKSPSPVGRKSASPIHMSRSPSPFKNRSPSPFGRVSRSQSQDSDMVDSMASEIMDEQRKQDNSYSSDDDQLNVNLMDIGSLLPATSSLELGRKKNAKNSRPTSATKKTSKVTSTSVFKGSVPDVFKADRLTDSIVSKKNQGNSKSVSSKSKSNLFESFGIQMVDDIMEMDIKLKDEEREVSVSEESEIVTEKSQDRVKPWKRLDSESEIKTDIGNKNKKAPVESQSSAEDTISERLNDRSSIGNIKLAFSSDERQRVDTDEDYSESFISESESRTITDKETRQHRSRSHKSLSHSSRASPRHKRKLVMEEKRVDISAADQHGQQHYWNATQTEVKVSGPFGLQYVDPALVATHVVSADALEALTAYSPNVLALQDMMRSQLQLITSFMDIQNRIYSSCLDGLKEDFQYTTLDDTKLYIEKNRKPRMSMDEALRLVDLESHGVAR